MPSAPQHNSRGILLIVLAMAGFAGEDALIKHLTDVFSVGQTLWMINLIGALFFLGLALRQRHAIFARANWQPILILRAVFEGISAIFFVTALAKVDISVVAAVFQTTPLATTMGAALIFREHVGWRRWSAILVGFLGVMLIVRPGGAEFNPYVLLVLLSVAMVSGRDLITRAMDASVPSAVVAFQGIGAIIPASVALVLLSGTGFTPLATPDLLRVILAAFAGIVGYFSLVTALRIAETGVIMPFRFSRLVFSIIIGVLVFAERPDQITLLGALLILASGLYTFLRERKLARLARANPQEELQTHGF